MRSEDILSRRCIIALFFLLWGTIWLLYQNENLLGKILSGFFIVFGIIIFIHSYHKIRQLKRTGDVEIIIDERAELNDLKASRRGFEFLLVSIAILMALWGFKLINETILTALIGPVFAIGSSIYVLAYYLYEKRG